MASLDVLAHSKADLVAALGGVLGRIDTQEAAARAVEAVCEALGFWPDADNPWGAVDALNEVYGYLIHDEHDKARTAVETALVLAGVDPATGERGQ